MIATRLGPWQAPFQQIGKALATLGMRHLAEVLIAFADVPNSIGKPILPEALGDGGSVQIGPLKVTRREGEEGHDSWVVEMSKTVNVRPKDDTTWAEDRVDAEKQSELLEHLLKDWANIDMGVSVKASVATYNQQNGNQSRIINPHDPSGGMVS